MYTESKVRSILNNKGKPVQSVVALALVIVLFSYCNPPKKKIPTGVEFHKSTLARKGNFGDNWCQTWAADNNVYTMMHDGNGWWGSDIKSKEHIGWSGSLCIQIQGGCKYRANLGFWYAENPWGPWKQFHYTECIYVSTN